MAVVRILNGAFGPWCLEERSAVSYFGIHVPTGALEVADLGSKPVSAKTLRVAALLPVGAPEQGSCQP